MYRQSCYPPEADRVSWSGRRDSNSRPPAPKAVSGMLAKLSIFNCLGFKWIRPSD